MAFFKTLFSKLGLSNQSNSNSADLYEEQVIVVTPYVPPVKVSEAGKKTKATQPFSMKSRRDAAQEIKKAIEVFFHGTQNLKNPEVKSTLTDYQLLLEKRFNKQVIKLDELDQQALRHYINRLKQARKHTEISPEVQKKIFQESDQILSKYLKSR